MSLPSIPEAMQGATANGTYHVTRDQLFTAWSDRVGGGGMQKLRVLLAFGAPIALHMAGAANWGPMGPVTIGAALLVLAAFSWRADVADEQTFDKALSTHVRRFGIPDRLLLKPRLAEAPPKAEGDVHDHGVAGILLVDDDRLVDFLVLNGVHAQVGYAVISKTGYPEYVLEPLTRLPDSTPLLTLHSTETSYQSMVDAARTLLPGRSTPPTRDLGMGRQSLRWFNPRNSLRRIRARRAPSMLMPAWFIQLLTRALVDGVTLLGASNNIHAERRRSRGSSSLGDTHGWG